MDENNPLKDFLARILGVATMFNQIPDEDMGPKEIGDKVLLVDINNMKYFCHFDTGEVIEDKDENRAFTDEAMILFAQEYIVADTDVEHIYNCRYCPGEHKCNTVIYSPDTKKKYYTNASDIKVIE